jgi:HlyD family secretion protein
MRRTALLLLLLAAGTGGIVWWQTRLPPPPVWQGYVDAEYVRVSPMLTGRLVSLAVERGDQVGKAAPLFDQDDTDDRAAREAAAGKLAEAQARLTNLQSASRDTEIASAEADLGALIATRDRIARDLGRSEELMRTGAASRQIVDQQRSDLAAAIAQAQAASAKLEQMRAPTGREHEIAAQSAVVVQARAALAQAEWRLAQRHVAAPTAPARWRICWRCRSARSR